MTFSNLTARTVAHHNKYASRQGTRIQRIIVHHWAGTQGGDSRLTNPNADVSTNYILYSDGTLVGQVPEEYRAWTSGSWAADAPSITVEVQNSAAGGEWPVSDAAISKLIALIADLANRYGWGSISFGSQVRGHREFVATACPGPYLWARLPNIASQAHARYKGGSSTPAPVQPSAPTGDLDSIARAVIRGDYGNGSERQRRLGSRYAEVQARVNQLLGIGAATSAPAPAAPNIDALADAVIRGDYGNGDERRRRLGNNYAAVQARVNQKLGITPAATQTSDDLDALARAVIRGDYGNGADRQNRLGSRYAEVQARVNQILGV